jgi:hypothetical protein
MDSREMLRAFELDADNLANLQAEGYVRKAMETYSQTLAVLGKKKTYRLIPISTIGVKVDLHGIYSTTAKI